MKRSRFKFILNHIGEGLMWSGWVGGPMIWNESHGGSRDEHSRETQI
jgi:hypothetical protein